MEFLRPFAAPLLLLLVLGACATRPDVRTEGSTLPPPAEAGTVAVFPFAGPHGDMLAGRVAYELLQRGYAVIPRQRVQALLAAEPGAGDSQRYLALARQLGADVAVVGTVTAADEPTTVARVADEFRTAASLKVTRARAEFLRVADGGTVTAAAFEGGRAYGVFTPNYRDAARELVASVTGE